MLNILKPRAFLLICAILMRVLLEAAYVESVITEFGYGGFYYSPSNGFTLLTYGATVFFALIVPVESSPAKSLTLLFYLLIFVPFGMIAAATDRSVSYYLLVCLFLFLLILIVRRPAPQPLQMADIPFGREIFVLMASGCIVLTIVLFLYYGGLALINFDIGRVYDVRWDINEILTGPIGYLADWSKYVFLPGILAFSLWRRNAVLIGATLLLFILFFGISSAKAVLLYPILILAIYFGVRWNLLTHMLTGSTLVAVVLGWAAYPIFGPNLFSSTILTRLFCVPPLDAYRYYEFFEDGEKMYLRNTLLGAPFRTVEMDNIALVIGQNTWGYGSEVYANTGVFATAYMHFGWFGMILFPLLVGGFLRLLDKLSVGRIPMEIAIPITAIVGIQFIASDLTTTLLSHGMALMFVNLLLIGQRAKPSSPQKMVAART